MTAPLDDVPGVESLDAEPFFRDAPDLALPLRVRVRGGAHDGAELTPWQVLYAIAAGHLDGMVVVMEFSSRTGGRPTFTLTSVPGMEGIAPDEDDYDAG